MQSLKFPVKNEEQLSDLLPDGEVDYYIVSAKAKTSAKGNEMFELEIKVKNKEGAELSIKDFLVFDGGNFSLRKIRHFCYSSGLETYYEKGELPINVITGRTGKAWLSRDKGKEDKATGKKYSPKNIIADYLQEKDDLLAAVNSLPSRQNKADEFNDDIPF